MGHTYSGAITTVAMASGLSSSHSLRWRGSLQSTPHASRSTSYAAVKAGSILVLHDSRDGRLAFYLPSSVIKCIPLTKQDMQICATCPLCLHPRRPIKQCPGVFLLDGEPALTCQTSGFYGCVSSMISSKTVAKPSKHVSSLQQTNMTVGSD